MKRILQRGFTLIELLVVIAIIGILASVVLASLNDARDKGEDAAVKSQLSSIRAEAEISYNDNNRSYVNACTAAAALLALPNGATADCFDVAGGWAAGAALSSGGYFCADYTGYSAELAADPTLADGNIDCL